MITNDSKNQQNCTAYAIMHALNGTGGNMQ